MRPVIYTMTFEDGDEYIGATTNYESRKVSHRKHSVNKLVEQKRRAGLKFTFSKVACGFDEESLHLLEKEVINSRNPTLNINRKPYKINITSNNAMLGWAANSKPFGIYPSLRSAAKALQADPALLRKCVTYENYLAYKKQPKQMIQRQITVGEKTLSVNEWAELIGIKPANIHARLYNGWSEAQAVGQEDRPKSNRGQLAKEAKLEKKKAKEIEYRGEKGSLSDLCRKYGKTDSVVRARLRLGWTVSDSFDTELCVHRDPNGRLDKIRELLSEVQQRTPS